MIVSDFISKLRRKYNDSPVKHEDVIQGDGSSTVFRTQFYPILEDSCELFLDNALQALDVYSIDLDTGDIDLAAPTSKEIKVHYQSVNFRDQNWLEAIQDAFDSFGDSFFKTVVRSVSGITLSAGITVYDCPSACIRLTESLDSVNYTSAGPFAQAEGVNKRYDRGSNKLILGRAPSRGNYMVISYLRRLGRPSIVSDTLDVENSWLDILDLKVGSIFLRSLANKYAQQGNATIEDGYLSVAQLRQLANDNEIMFENRKKQIKPVMPSSVIPYYVHGGGKV